ncbi:hypothetical protein SDC9_110425 [bioreactor metagenome]|uniref:SMODS and SLOG-associating 2TM effector domain-containing protein n=1 Tax=bioreactor metagenome TaxID=1076179 RepID=A0A645BDM3_9ZZZZ
MVQLKAWMFYLDEYTDDSYKWDKRINIFLAITSSSSIAAWAIWNKYGFVWALLIALSQVVTAIKPQLPFSKRLETLCKISNQLQILFNKADYNWYKVSNGELAEEQINDLLFELKKQYIDTIGKTLEADPLPENGQFKAVADTKTEKYFQDTY